MMLVMFLIMAIPAAFVYWTLNTPVPSEAQLSWQREETKNVHSDHCPYLFGVHKKTGVMNNSISVTNYFSPKYPFIHAKIDDSVNDYLWYEGKWNNNQWEANLDSEPVEID